jgi:Putative beta-barrel porin-2, OmpL-like. bbp2
MRLPICILALAMSAWAADPDTAQPADTPTADQAATPAPAAQAPAPADAAKPADATPPAPPPKYDGFVFSGLADGYFTTNFNHPMGSANQFYNFDINNATPEMSLVKVTVDKSDKLFGFHVDAGFGETMRLIHAGDVAAQDHKALRYIEQMYLIAKPNHTHGTEFDFGQFVTSAGAEVIEANANWNYSRSLLFALAIPYYHFGLRTSTPVTKTWTVGLQVVNAWNTVWGNNDMKNVGVTSALTETKYTWSVNYYVGPNNPGTTSGQRNLVDTTLLLTPNSKINYYINGDYGQNDFAGGGSANWYGVAGAATFHVTSKFAISPRAEVFDDHNGFMTGKAQAIKEGTITGEYKYNDHFIGRLEYRHDSTNTAFFDRGAQMAVVNGQNTFTLALLAVLGPLK